MTFRLFWSCFLAVAAISGCKSTEPSTWQGPTTLQPVASEPWNYHNRPGQTLKTEHYQIHTTIPKDDFLNRLAQVMEGAHEQYQKLAPQVKTSDRPMDCYVFANRFEWAAFTREHTGDDSKVYLKINRGGYTIGDWFVAYFIGDINTFPVAAHEGWHQYVSRNFKSRLPPFLEEGIATQFEAIRWEAGLPRWNLDYHPMRAQRLRRACDDHYLWPLEQLVTMHAGDVVGLSGEKIEAFYAQNWAFARFLWDADGGKYRPAFQKLLVETANGTVYDPTGRRPAVGFQPQSIRPLLEHYLQMPFPAIEQAYLKYVHEVAYDRFNEQWQARGP
jgi:hypothetical protein